MHAQYPIGDIAKFGTLVINTKIKESSMVDTHKYISPT